MNRVTSELARLLGVRQSTLNYQVSRLEDKGFVTEERKGRKVHCFAKQPLPPPAALVGHRWFNIPRAHSPAVAKRTFRRAREVLNEIRWREGGEMGLAEIWFADRNSPTGCKIIPGTEITETGRGYFSTADAMLPYYKIIKIEYEGKVLFDRREADSKMAKPSSPGSKLEKRH